MGNEYFLLKHGELESEYQIVSDGDEQEWDDEQGYKALRATAVLSTVRGDLTWQGIAKLMGNHRDVPKRIWDKYKPTDSNLDAISVPSNRLSIQNDTFSGTYTYTICSPKCVVERTALKDCPICRCNVRDYPECYYCADETPVAHIDPRTKLSITPTVNELVFGSIGLCITNTPDQINLREIPIADIIAFLMTQVLVELHNIHPNLKYQRKMTYAKSMIEVIICISQRNGISSKNSSFRYLMEHDKEFEFAKFFERYGSYQVGIEGYKYRLKEYTTTVFFPRVLKLFERLQIAIPKSYHQSDIIVPSGLLHTVKTKDMFYLLTQCKGKDDRGFVVNNVISDEQYSRKYSVMTSISGTTRKLIGYDGYDISACLQSISLQVLDKSKYPVHNMLLRNKHRIRMVLMKRLDKKLPEVKQILSASDNGKKYKLLQEKSKLLQRYILESENLAIEFNSWFKENHSKRYNLAHELAKPLFKRDGTYDPNTGKANWIVTNEKNVYSLFFFCWTQIERDIRDVMISCIQDGIFAHEVHDAIYVPIGTIVNVAEIEDKIFDTLGLKIRID